MKALTQHKLFLTIAAIGFAYRLFFAWHSISQGILIADDAYYYFTIARNIIAGFGPTFDRLAPTNGFHPLWMLVLLPLFKLFGYSLWLPIQMAMSLIAIFDLISGIVIYRIFDDKGYRRAGLIAAAFWFLSAFTVFTSLRGMEVSLAVMLALLLFRSVSNILDSANSLTIRSAIMPGILLGLSSLARTDYLIMLGIPIALLAIYKFRKTQSSRAALWLITLGAVAFLIILPWLIWNYSVFGSIMQVSGAAKMHFRARFGIILSDGIIGLVRWLAYNVLAPIVFPAKFLAGEDFNTPKISILVILGGLLLLALPLILISKSRPRSIEKNRITSILCLSTSCIIIQILLYGVIIRIYAAWYALLFYAMLAILLGASIERIFGIYARRKKLIWGMIILLIVFNIALHPLFLIRGQLTSVPPESFHGPALKEIAAHYPNGVKVGAFNSGAIGYIAPYYGKFTVINLDCLVNNRAFEAIRKDQYFNYVNDNIDVLVENPSGAWAFLSASEMDSLRKIYTKHDGQNYWEKSKGGD